MSESDTNQLELELNSVSKSGNEHVAESKEESSQNPRNVISINKVRAERSKKEDARVYKSILSLADHLY